MNKYIEEVLEKRGISSESLDFKKEENLNWDELDTLSKEIAMDIFYKKEYKNIAILYDPDVDGLFSGYVMEDFLKRAGFNSKNIFRFMNENKVHGVSNKLIDFCDNNQINLLFVVDAGSSDTLVFHEKLPNTRVIVLDHHEYTEQSLPDTTKVSLLNVNDYEHLPSLSGCGVVFRFVEGMNRFLDVHIDMYEIYVGITVLSDSCSMDVPENRYYVSKAYQNNDYNVFLKTFKDAGFYGSNISLFSFKIIPYLNALIRIGREELAMKIVNNMESQSLKSFLLDNEKEVKAIQAREVEKIIRMSQEVQGDGFTILLRKSTDELKTLNGLVANKIMSQYSKSALVLRIDNENDTPMWKGSFRGLDFSNTSLEKYGFDCRGHAKACGAMISPENLRSFVSDFEYIPEFEKDVDLEMTLEELNKIENLKAIAEFNEYASGNIPPITIRIVDEFNSSNARKVAKGFSGKFFIITFKDVDITDFTPTPINEIEDLVVTVNLSKYNPYQVVRKS